MREETPYTNTSPLNLDPPDGWIYLNKKFVEENFAEKSGRELSKINNLENFFNGRMQTSFDIALTSSVPRRFYVKDLQEKINLAAQNSELRVTLLTGPGGEGKSTILQQLAIDLVNQSEPKFQVLFRDFGSQANLPIKYLEKLLNVEDESKTTHNFLIVSDNAHEIAKDVFRCIESGIEYKKHNIQFLLASRGTHWRWQDAHHSNWKRLTNDDYEIKITKLTEEDAEKIVIAWDNAKNQNNENVKERAAKLFNAAKDGKISGKTSNSFYRAIFQLRKNKTLESYISDILGEFENIQILDGRLTLKDFYAYIVVLHADGFPILNIPILCQALGCEEHKLREAVELLADEKDELFSESNKYILTRHDVFAEESQKILLEQNYPAYFDKILSELVVAARQYYKNNETYNSIEIRKWSRLPEIYFYDLDKDNEANRLNRKRQAITMAEALGKRFYSEPVLITQWAKFLREDGNLKQASQILNDFYQGLKRDKAYFVEWAVCLGLLNKNLLSVWLAAIALSDEVIEAEGMSKVAHASLEERQIGHLCSLCTAFSKSYAKFDNSVYTLEQAKIFKSATESCLRLISNKWTTENKKADFNFNEAKIRERIGSSIIPELSIEKSFDLIESGIELAYQLRNLDNETLPDSLPRPPLNLNKIKSIFGVGLNVTNQKIDHTFITKVLVKKEPTQIISQPYTESNESTENLNYIFRKLTSEWEFVFEDKNTKISDKYELEGFKYIKLALESPNLEIDVSSDYPSQAIHHSIYNNIRSRVFDAINNFEFSIPDLFIYLNKTIQVSGAKGKVTILYKTTELVVKEVDDYSSSKTKKIKIEHPKIWLTK